MTDHGRIIPLTPAPYEHQRNIEVFAGYATRDHPAVALQVEEKLKQIREMSRENSVEVRTRSRINLDGARAQRVVVHYYDKKLNRWSVEDFIEALRKGIEYSLYLRTKEASYPQDRVVFERLVSSFSFTLE